MANVSNGRIETPIFNRFFETVAQRLDTALNGRLGAALRSSTALTPAGGMFSSNRSFGVNFAMQSSVTRDWSKSATSFAKLTVEEVRDRISSLIDGEFLVESFQELIDYLKERSLALEGRILQGKMINFLVDTKTKQSIPAAQVHPSLSSKNTRTLELRGVVRRLVGNSDPAETFGSWQGMEMVMQNTSEGYAYTVSNNEGFIGKVYDVATANADENLAIIRRARSEGIQLILPSASAANPNDLVPGMAILRASKSMKAAEINPSLDHRRLTSVFGETMISAYQEMANKSERFASNELNSGLSSGAKVVSFEDFKARYAAKPVEPVQTMDDDALGFGGLGGVVDDKRNIGLRRGSDSQKSLAVWDFDLNMEVEMSPTCLPEGEYKRYTSNGSLEGYSVVGNKGNLTHLDKNRQPEKVEVSNKNEMEDYDNSSSLRLHR